MDRTFRTYCKKWNRSSTPLTVRQRKNGEKKWDLRTKVNDPTQGDEAHRERGCRARERTGGIQWERGWKGEPPVNWNHVGPRRGKQRTALIEATRIVAHTMKRVACAHTCRGGGARASERTRASRAIDPGFPVATLPSARATASPSFSLPSRGDIRIPVPLRWKRKREEGAYRRIRTLAMASFQRFVYTHAGCTRVCACICRTRLYNTTRGYVITVIT